MRNMFHDLTELDQSSEQPKVLWSLMFSYEDKTNFTIQELRKDQPDGAKDIFEQICPGEEFLPPAPNPEDIIFEEPTGDNPGHGKKAGFEAESQEEKDQHEAITSASGSLQETDQSGSSSLPGADQSESSSLPGADLSGDDKSRSSSLPGADQSESSSLPGADQSGSSSISGTDDLTSKEELKEESKNESQTKGKDHKSE
ncbi:putative rab proteins geranylgeranyltransferase component A 2 isoform X2 [Apostichopus japonicus]|uniref:Putative rab proteins geranylgeranyltransferase component A 2 isoform X2 n=1 Tax=Stichopus japonicus TaxID=307972 RepID=A0A2G8JG66_STIJA|nr:putative rab proteins geranylgeranyltransferase component A 2 isoform X2 [Apostichopus japonicus]